MRRVTFVLIALSLGIQATHAEGAGKAQSPDAPAAALSLFRGDARLQTRVTLAEKERPLADVLSSLGARLKVGLSASPETADDRVTLFLDNRPAADVLALIAEHFDFHWAKRGRGYQLELTRSARRRETDLREAFINEQWSNARAMIDLTERVRSLTPEQREARKKAVQASLASADLRQDERVSLEQERTTLHEASFPAAKLGSGFFRTLSPAQILAVRQGKRLRFSTLDGTLTRDAAAPIMEAGARNVPLREGQEQQADVIFQFQAASNFGQFPPPEHRPSWQLRIGMPTGSARAYFPLAWTAGYAAPPPPARLAPVDDPLWKREVLLIPRIDPPVGDPMDLAQRRRRKLASLGDLSQALHKELATEVIADGFARGRFEASAFTVRQSVGQVVEKLAKQRYSVRKAGGLLRVRNELYYLDRPRETPERLLSPWRRQVIGDGRIGLDALARLAMVVDENRMLGLTEWWRGYFDDPLAGDPDWAMVFRNAYRHLRYWGSLSETQRQAARGGAILPLPQMSQPQRQALLAAVEGPGDTPTPLWIEAALGAEELPALGFKLGQREIREQTYRLDSARGSIQFNQRFDPNRPTSVPNGATPVGSPSTLDEYMFIYQVAGREEPVRRAPVVIRRPTAKQ